MVMKRVVTGLFLAIILILPIALFVSTNFEEETVIITQTRSHTTSQYQTSSPIEIGGDTDFVALVASGVGTRSDPYVIENLDISTRAGPCIFVHDTTSFFTIYNCILESDYNEPAIQFDNVENGQVMLCDIRGGSSGIDILNSQDCSISNTSIYGCWVGVNLNIASLCTTTYSRISGNNRGMIFASSSDCQIVNNSIYSNTENGLVFASSSYNNTVYGNSFGWNDISMDLNGNAVDNGENNHFDDSESQGNAWTDFNDTIPYEVQGTSGSIDSFPVLLEDTEAPVVSELYDTAIDVETTGNALIWTASDDFPLEYTIRIDDGPEWHILWNGDDITVDLDALLVGTYRYILTVYDGAGNTASDEVSVAVISFVLGGIGTELVMIASAVTVVFFLVIVLFIKKLS